MKLNRDKTKVTGPTEVKYLGFSFYIVKEKIGLIPHPKSIKKMKEKVRELTKRSSGRGYECQKAVLKEFIEGWVEYFKIADEEKARMLAGSRKGLCATTAFRDLNYIITNKSWKQVTIQLLSKFMPSNSEKHERHHAPDGTHGAGRGTKYFND